MTPSPEHLALECLRVAINLTLAEAVTVVVGKDSFSAGSLRRGPRITVTMTPAELASLDWRRTLHARVKAHMPFYLLQADAHYGDRVRSELEAMARPR